jgi:predicted dehydrogenase
VAPSSFTLPTPRNTDPRAAPVLRWGILAPGVIAGDFVSALHKHTDQAVVAVGSRNAERAAEFATTHGIDRSYGSYEALVADPDVDVVYVAAPHSEHVRLALLAIAAGNHVLVEKPLATSEADGRLIIDAARAAGVFAMEAMWTRFLPQTDITSQLLERGDLGELTFAFADFAGLAPTDPTGRLMDPALGGGALLDLGVYVVWWAMFALGRPVDVAARGMIGPTGVDLQAALILTAESGAQAQLSTGLRGRTVHAATIAGSLASVEMVTPFWSAGGLRVVGADGSVLADWSDPFGRPARQGLSYQAAEVARCIAEGRQESLLHPNEDALAVLATIDEARRQIHA